MKVLAGIVTYNRLALLKECIASLRAQTFQDVDILVVNNNSTDGTREYLDDEQSLIVIHQENLGGAGGFYTCQKYAVENGYNYVWLMDDDGLAAPNQLELLLDGVKKYQLDWANALVVNKEDHSMVCDDMTIEAFCDYWGSREVFPYANPFNGTLLSCEAVKKIGYIKKEMYIWGDESEYFKRFKAKGFKLATIVAAVHYHPKFKVYDDYVFPFIKKGPKISVKPLPYSKYAYRNLGYLNKIYGNRKIVKKYLLYFLLRCRLKELYMFYRCYNLGWNEDYETRL